MKTYTCTLCGAENVETFDLTIGAVEHELCKSCLEDEGYIVCADCGDVVSKDDAVETVSGNSICQSCYENDYFTCEDCGEVHPLDYANRVNPDTRHEMYVCDDCAEADYFFCDHCQQYFSRTYLAVNSDDHTLCEDCARYYVECDRCHSLVHEDDAYYDSDHNLDLCPSCWAARSRNSCYFHGYDYKPEVEFYQRKGEDFRNTLYFGLELEVDKGDDHNKLSDALGEMGEPIYMKHDGSLDDEGVEIVTHPCSLAYHTYQLRWKGISRTCLDHGYRSHDTHTCGLHIHVGRAQMGETSDQRDMTVGNLVILTKALWGTIEPFTRRTKSALARWAECNDICNWESLDQYDDISMTNLALETRWNRAGRYQAVNLCNSETVEFRIFRGSLNRETIIASVQLVNNLTRYAMTHTPKECYNATWLDVLNVERFAELVSYCERMHLPTT